MKLEGEQVLLRIFVDSFRRYRHRPLYEAIVEHARRRGYAGATVFEGIEGFGMSGIFLKEKRWALANDREMVIELVDTPQRLDALLEELEPMLEDVVVTRERAKVVRYLGHGRRS
ncbi:MAG: DUF190 domain-containing protein [Candidatus Hydrogenedentota bacterium]|jgi:PII-like signaling protein|uniref:Uncharacterized protein n=1 Tax=Sumerlaea chitinivorans TaxID=2250252 RepID=A0A2Z4Y4Q1_SUMC1|nr:hypothetical protein BRCON_1404 [Candidatus Sumerlaea chitinivorans]MCX7964199.1 DUF190 domain-containing protein [Candidatus Sumerlaea chitinivorans]RMH28514.1 MAG: DUF190 domain-containing protein [Candidatus Hydrogenedentota bacterium]GIX44936.1 MAG: hypothetical protein KatS3mg130_1344 [Candidatus Sumerlaea sp.]